MITSILAYHVHTFPSEGGGQHFELFRSTEDESSYEVEARMHEKVNQLAKEWGNKLEIIAAGTLISEIIYVPQKIITEYTPQTKK